MTKLGNHGVVETLNSVLRRRLINILFNKIFFWRKRKKNYHSKNLIRRNPSLFFVRIFYLKKNMKKFVPSKKILQRKGKKGLLIF